MKRIWPVTTIVVAALFLFASAGAPGLWGVAAAAQTPALTLTPSSGPPNTGVGVRGANFQPGIFVAIDFGGSATAISGNRVDQNRMVDANGTFMTSFSVFDSSWAGCTICPVKAVDQSNNRILAVETFTFTASPPPATATRAPTPTTQTVGCTGQAPSFPTQLVQGQAATFVAWGFEAGAAVTISVTGGPTGTVAASSNCQVSLRVSTSTADPPGPYTITATGPKAGGGSQTVTSTFTLAAATPASGSGQVVPPSGQGSNAAQPRNPVAPTGGSQANPPGAAPQGGQPTGNTAQDPGQPPSQDTAASNGPESSGSQSGSEALPEGAVPGAVTPPEAGPPPAEGNAAPSGGAASFSVPPDAAASLAAQVNEPPTSDEEAVTAELAVLLGALAMGTGGGPATTACVLREVRSLDDAGDDMMGRIGACVADLEAAANAIGGDPGAINYVTAEACARYISISDALPNGGFYQGVTRTSDPQLFAERVVACYAVVEDLRSGGPGR